MAACSSDQRGGERLGSVSQALTSEQQRILGFEAVGGGSADWTSTSGSISQSSQHVEGNGSLAIANSGNTTITSAALSSLGPVADKITLDLLLPAAQPNPYWLGTLKIVIECPSQQLWWEGLAEHQLTGNPTGQFLRFEFPLSASTRQKLSTGTYTDLRFKILLNVETGAGPWLIDRLWVTEPGGGGSGGTGGSSSGGTGGTAGQGGSSTPPSANDSILGFEDPALWTTSAGALASSDVHLQGASAVQVSGIGYAEITSAPLTTLSSVASVIGFDLSVPNPAGDVWWWGSAAISVDCPSKGIYGRWLGQQELNGSALDRFRRVEVNLPDDVKNALSTGSYGDLRVKVILTVPQGSGPYILDRFTFASQQPEPAPPAPSLAATKAVGFETLEAWKASAATLSLSSNAIEGSSSLAVSNFTYTELTSQRLSSLGAQVASPLSVKLWVPPPPNPDWAGSVALAIDLPSAGIYSQWIGQFELQGFTGNTWHALTFELPQATVAALQGTYSDLRIKLILNRPAQLDPFIVDELGLENFKPASPVVVEEYVVPLPKGMSFANVAVGQALIRTSSGDASPPVSAGPVSTLTPLTQAANVVAPRMGRTGGDASVTVGPWVGNVSAFLDVLGGPITGTARAGRNVIASATTSSSNFNLESFEAGRIRVEYPADMARLEDIDAVNHIREVPPGDYGFVQARRTILDAISGLVLRSGVYRMRALSGSVRVDNTDGPVFIHVKEVLRIGGWSRTVPEKHNVLVTFAGTEPGLLNFDDTLIAPRVATLASETNLGGTPPGSLFARSVELTDTTEREFHPFVRDDCASLANSACGVFGCDTTDADADGLYDCEETAGAWADPNVFNGVRVRASTACQSSGGDACAAIDTLAEVDACRSNPALLAQNMYSGWDLRGQALQGVGCQDEMDFWPPWSQCTGSESASYDYTGLVQLSQDGVHCFRVAGGSPNLCGSLFFDAAQEGVTSTSGNQCFDVLAGVYPIRWFFDAPQASVSDRLSVLHCFGGNEECEAEEPISQSLLRIRAICVGDSDCAQGEFCADDGTCKSDSSPCDAATQSDCRVACPCRGGSKCDDDNDCEGDLVCALGLGPAFGFERGTSVCVRRACTESPTIEGCGFEGAPCGSCDPVVTCTNDSDCPGAEVCRDDPSASDTTAPKACLPADCEGEGNECGYATSKCRECECETTCATKQCGDESHDGCQGRCTGFCDDREGGCKNDSDCPVGDACVRGGGPRVGLAAGVNVCLPKVCLAPDPREVNCGSIGDVCGICPAVPADVCAGRECGVHPLYGVACGPTNVPCVGGKIVPGFSSDDVDLFTADRENIPPLQLPALPVVEPRDEVTSEVPGALAGSFAVDARGNATYTIPIVVPPGRAGMQPRLSLSYNSRGGNGIAGIGWTVDGLSSIARCAKISATDGFPAPVRFDDTDAFCLDGARLVLRDGDNGQPNAEYRTEIDSFQKVVIKSADDGVYFEVRRKDGQIWEYGLTASERLYREPTSGNRVPRAWAVSKIRDRAGNKITFTYGKIENAESRTFASATQDTVEFYPDEIVYGGVENARGSRESRLKVKFDYGAETRNDYMEGFTSGGSRITRTQLLRAIHTSVADQAVRSYELAYKNAPTGLDPSLDNESVGPSRLDKIQECTRKNGARACMPATTLTYSDRRGLAPGTTLAEGRATWSGPVAALDVHGDGFTDLLVTVPSELSDDIFYEVLQSNGARSAPQFRFLNGGFGAGGVEGDFDCLSQSSVVDVDGDGRDELVDLCPRHRLSESDPESLHRFHIYEVTKDEDDPESFNSYESSLRETVEVEGFSFSRPRAFLVDANGDGIKDIFECADPDGEDSPGEAYYFAGRRGDGPAFERDRSGVITSDDMRGNCANFLFPKPAGQRPIRLKPSPITIQDVTGDGIDDLLMHDPGEPPGPGESLVSTAAWYRYAIDADGQAHWEQVYSDRTPAKVWDDSAKFRFLDVNGDGLRDLITLDSTPQLAINMGGSFSAAGSLFATDVETALVNRFLPYSLQNSLGIDYDGDGAEDLLRLLNPFTNDPPNAPSHWLWDRANTDPAGNATLRLDTAPLDLTDPTRFFLTVQPGTTPPSEPRNIPRPPFAPAFTLADVDGDGSVDLTELNDDGDIAVTFGQFGQENLLTAVVDGLGKRIDVAYDRDSQFSDSSVARTYRPACSPDEDTNCVRQVGAVVSSYTIVGTTDEAEDPDVTYHFRYEEGRAGLRGRGWLGFGKTIIEKVQATDPETLIELTEIVRDNRTLVADGYLFPFAGREISRTVTTAVAQSLLEKEAVARRETTTQQWETETSTRDGLFPFVDSTTGETAEVLADGTVRPIQTTTTLVIEIDGYGNVKEAETTTTAENGQLAAQTVTTDFDPRSEEDWLISLPTRRVVTEQVFEPNSPKPEEVRVISRHYDEDGLLDIITREPDEDEDSPLRLVTTLHRSEGVERNVRTVTVAGAWRDDDGALVERQRAVSYQYDKDGILPRRTIRHVGEDCPIDSALGDATDSGFGSTCLIDDMKLDPRDGTLTGGVNATGVGFQMSYDGFGRILSRVTPDSEITYSYESGTPALDASLEQVPTRMEVLVTDRTRGGTSTQRIDSLGRIVQIESSGLDDDVVLQEFRYVWGSVVQSVTRPHLEGDNSQGAIRNTYDPRWRLTQRFFPDDTALLYLYAAAFNVVDTVPAQGNELWVSGVLDRRSHVSLNYSDFRGAPLRTRDEEGHSTQFIYDAFGTLGIILDSASNISVVETDKLGRPISHRDRDTGRRDTTYTAFGEMLTFTDGVDTDVPRTRVYDYDDAGRVLTIASPEGITSFLYDQGANAMGRLVETASPDQHVEHYAYEDPPSNGDPMRNRAFLEGITRDIAGSSFTTTLSYDPETNQLNKVAYPPSVNGAGFTAQYEYDSVGYLKCVHGANEGDLCDDDLFWKRDESYQGQAVQSETFGNGVTASYSYEDTNGRLKSLMASDPAEEILQHLEYLEYDGNGNLKSRRSSIQRPGASSLDVVDESFDYDALDRLTDVTTDGDAQSIGYDAIGNITSKDGVGDYKYVEAGKQFRPHAVQNVQVGGTKVVDLVYDDYGNVENRSGEGVEGGSQDISYSSFDLPTAVALGTGSQIQYQYDASQRRVLVDVGDCSDPTSTTCNRRVYAGEGYERQTATDDEGAFTRDVYKVFAGGRQIAQVQRETRASATLESRRYMHADHLGSSQLITDEEGSVVDVRTFSPFGEVTPSTGDDAAAGAIRAGFTGHESDVETGLVNMRGRIYDPRLGRFLQADPPFAQSPLWSQGLNRYSYVFNNPLRFTDPSGFQTEGEGEGGGGWTFSLPGGEGTQTGESCICGCEGYVSCVDAGWVEDGGASNDPSEGEFRSMSESSEWGYNATVGAPGVGDDITGSILESPRIGPPTEAEFQASLWQWTAEDQAAAEWYFTYYQAQQQQVSKANELLRAYEVHEVAKAHALVGLMSMYPPLGVAMGVAGASDDSLPTSSRALHGAGAAVSALPMIGMFRGLGGAAIRGPGAYSVAFEATLTERGIGTYAAHFAEANEQLLRATANPELAAVLRQTVGANFEGTIVSSSGRILGSSPAGWTWHHVADQPGLLQLVPGGQHAPGSAWQGILHPGGQGGMAIWGWRF